MTKNICTAEGCERGTIARGLCTMHYQRQKAHGTTEKQRPRNARLDFILAAGACKERCDIWPFGRGNSGQGYGVTKFNGKQTTAHRASLIIHKGNPPSKEYEAAHDPFLCGSKLCVNPLHLRWATRAENEKDKVAAGTKTMGVKASTSDLTEKDVISIFRSVVPAKIVAKEYGVCPETIWRIRSGRTWSWLTTN